MTKDIKVIGMDISDRKVDLCLMSKKAEILDRIRLVNTRPQLEKWFSGKKRLIVALETGTHSRWISSLLEDLGHEVIVANARALKVIYTSDRKTDHRDAEMLARLALSDPKLLAPIKHRSKQAHMDLTLIHSRDQMVKSRTQFVTHVRGVIKAMGLRIKKCSTASFVATARKEIPKPIIETFNPVLDVIEVLSEKIKSYDKKIEIVSKESYPETARLRQIKGVGPVVALTYVLTIEDPARFKTSRHVGAYLGLTVRQNQSGERDIRSRITKSGSTHMRWLLVQSAQHMMGPFGEDCDLRRWGMAYATRGGPSARKRARIAVARKLAVMMHALWRSGQNYDPDYLKNNQAA
jgi:transposase